MITINPFNNCVYTQPPPPNYLPFGYQLKPPGLTQTNTVCLIRPSFSLNSVQPNPNEMPPTEQSIQYGPVTFPPFFHPSTALYAITPVDMMDIAQTRNWISTLGRFKGWKEAEMYAKNFRENDICGKTLQGLTSHILESDLGVTNVIHRRKLLSTIRSLYPQPTASLADSFCSESHSINTTSTKTFESTPNVVNDGYPSRTRGTFGSISKYIAPSEFDEDSYTESESFNCRSSSST